MMNERNDARRFALPIRLEPRGQIGWTVIYFDSRAARADYMLRFRDERMPAWNRIERDEV